MHTNSNNAGDGLQKKLLRGLVTIGLLVLNFVVVKSGMAAGNDNNNRAIIPYQATATSPQTPSTRGQESPINWIRVTCENIPFTARNWIRVTCENIPFTASPKITAMVRDINEVSLTDLKSVGGYSIIPLDMEELDKYALIGKIHIFRYIKNKKFFYEPLFSDLVPDADNLIKGISEIKMKKDVGLTLFHDDILLEEKERQSIRKHFDNIKNIVRIDLNSATKITDLIGLIKEKRCLNFLDFELVAPKPDRMMQLKLQNKHIIEVIKTLPSDVKEYLIKQILSDGIIEELDLMLSENAKKLESSLHTRTIYSDDNFSYIYEIYKKRFLVGSNVLDNNIQPILLKKGIDMNNFSGKEKKNIALMFLDSNVFNEQERFSIISIYSNHVDCILKSLEFIDVDSENKFKEKIKDITKGILPEISFSIIDITLIEKERKVLGCLISTAKNLPTIEKTSLFIELFSRGLFEILEQQKSVL